MAYAGKKILIEFPWSTETNFMQTKTLMIIFLVLAVHGTNAQSPLSPGTYGAYLDASNFTELTLNPDKSFQYLDQFELGSPVHCVGQWKVQGQKLLLTDCEDAVLRPVPLRWRIRGAELISKKVKNGTGIKARKLLYYKKDRREESASDSQG